MSAAHRYPFLNSYVDALDMQQTLKRIETIIEEKRPVQHVVINAGKIVLMHESDTLRDIVNDCALINADGQAIVWAARLLGIPLPERVAGVDLMYALFSLAEQRGYGVYILGARDHVLRKAISEIERQYPQLRIVGAHHGYFKPDEEATVVSEIAASGAELLFVAMSSPNKELWLRRCMPELGVPFCMGVGGSIDIVGGYTKRAPRWMQRAGLEWFYRLAQEPRRMWKRYMVGNSKFIMLVVRSWLTSRRRRATS